MDRRAFLSTIAILAAPLVSEGQPAKVPRIGILTLVSAASIPEWLDAFRQGLREHGYVEGQNITLEHRSAEGRGDKLPALATEFVRGKVDVIVTESNAAGLAAKQATQTVPIVMAIAGDPVKAGVVASLARPGGNVTGLTLLQPDLSGKRLQFLKEAVPTVTLVAVIWNPTNPVGADFLRETGAAARSLGLQLKSVEVRNPADLDSAFKAVADARPGAFFTLPDGMLVGNRVRIVEFATKNRLPGIYPEREFVKVGGLMSYGPNVAANFRRSAAFVDKILKGAKPADLPIEQPTKLELVVNLKTARALGLTIPQSVLGRADQIIQ